MSKDPFWGCGLVGKSIDPTANVWSGLINDLSRTSDIGKVSTWNWDVAPQKDDHLNDKFLFFPNAQCGGTSADSASTYTAYVQGKQFGGGAFLANMALGGNEPDQIGYCQDYTSPGPHSVTDCDGRMMAAGKCTGNNECKCLNWNPETQCTYDVTGCGMWPLNAQSCPTNPATFPFDCVGQHKSQACPPACKQGMVDSFKKFYQTLAEKGYEYASTPIVASDVSFNRDLLEAAGCSSVQEKGLDRLRKGCPTHSAFHFYSSGCPDLNNPDASISDFKNKVSLSKQLNSDFHLQGTIVNELGSLQVSGSPDTCPDENISGMMKDLFAHLKSPEGSGVVSQMVWFNQDQIGGTYDLTLVRGGELSLLGKTYSSACQDWAKSEGRA